MRVSINGLVVASALALAPAGAAAHEEHAPAAKVDYSKAAEMPFGMAADPASAARSIAIEMGDTMRYKPDRITVKRGEAVRIVATNTGKVMHELVLGTRDDLKEHAEAMRKHPGMHHDEPYMLHVAPGATAEMGWRFTRAGTFFYGCLVPGHFEAGMVGHITVE